MVSGTYLLKTEHRNSMQPGPLELRGAGAREQIGSISQQGVCVCVCNDDGTDIVEVMSFNRRAGKKRHA